MNSPAFIIAGVTMRQAMRDRVLHLLVGGALAAIACSKAIGWVTPAESAKVITDMTLAVLSIFSVLVAVVLGGRLIREDVDRRTLHTICAKDVSRGAVIVGKYLGLLAAFAVSLAAASCAASVYLFIAGGTVSVGFFAAVAGLFGELAVLVAASILFSTMASPVVAAAATLGIWVIGHVSPSLLPWFTSAWREGGIRTFFQVLRYLLPDLEAMNFRSEASHALPVQP
ncbi:MAG: ABC transporter permease, partial [Planctomycetota bacterium]